MGLYAMTRFSKLASASTLAIAISVSTPAWADGTAPCNDGSGLGSTECSEYAVGGSMNYRLNTEAPIAVGVGFSYGGGKNNAVRVGVAGEF